MAPFGGADCKKAMPCPVAFCSGHGVCQDGLCSCVDGWMGTGCGQEEPKVPPMPVKKSSRTRPEEEEEDVKCFNDCSGHGVCGRDGKCSCVHTYGGLDCSERNLCKRNCGQRGLCVENECMCAPGYAGELCTDRVPPAACPGHCSGRGYCVNGVCKCDLGWGGEACDARVTISPCARDCSYRGHCAEGSNGKHHCACAFSYFGLDCSSQYDCPFDCSKHGICQEGQCLCASGWGDYDCAKPVDRADTECENDCSGRGVCGKHGKCECVEGFAGADCSKKAPCPDKCSGRGKCDAGKCLCAPGFKGANCGRNVLGMEEEDLEAQMDALRETIDGKEGALEDAQSEAERLAAAVPPEPVVVEEEVSSAEEAAMAAAETPATRASPFADRGEPASPEVTPSRPTPDL